MKNKFGLLKNILFFIFFIFYGSDICSKSKLRIKKKISESAKQDELVDCQLDKDKFKKKTNFNVKKPSKGKFYLNFENAALKNVLDYISTIFDVNFLSDDAVGDEKKIKGVGDVKITFKSNKPLSEQKVWEFLDLLLEIAGLARIQMPGQRPNFYRITQIATANKSNIPTFVGTDLNELPDFQRIRYMYFVQNRQANQIKDLLSRLQSKTAQIEIFQELNVLIITDNAYNIKTLMKLIKELDDAGLPEVLSILKLKNADASDVAKLYESLKGKEDVFRPFTDKKITSRLTENTKVIAEPRSNALIVFGPKDSVKKLEDFIKKHIDKEIYAQNKIHIYELNYAPAEQIANILNSVTQFGAESEAARLGGMRGGEKYLSKMYFEPEKQSNRLIIRGDPEDYKIVKKIIEELDVQQPQVAIEVFIVTINLEKKKQWQSQIRNPCNETVNFQTSGFFGNGIQVNSANNSGSLITNLIGLASSADVGSTLVTLGKQSVWAILGALEQTTDAKIISNPFLVATNKYTATVSLGETRRITTGTIVGSSVTENEFGEIQANVSVSITPQINDFGIINLNIDVTVDDFLTPATLSPNDPNFGNKETRKVHTNANVADQEVLALGGLIRNRISVVESGIPILSKIPLLGFLFKNKTNVITKENLIIFMSPRIIRPTKSLVSRYTINKANEVRDTLADIDSRSLKRDPIYRWFFNEPFEYDNKIVNNFLLPKEGTPNLSARVEKIGTKNDIEYLRSQEIVLPKRRRSLVNFVNNNKI